MGVRGRFIEILIRFQSLSLIVTYINVETFSERQLHRQQEGP